jgi:hypothetical protein
MPAQNTHTVTNVGDEITADITRTLPAGAVITDNADDWYVRTPAGAWIRHNDQQPGGYPRPWSQSMIDYLFDPEGGCLPVRLQSLPDGHDGLIRPSDTYQAARLALRDLTGTDPAIDDVHAVERIMQDRDLDSSTAASRFLIETGPAPAAPDVKQDDEHARAFLRSYHQMDRALLGARDRIAYLEAGIASLTEHPEVGTVPGDTKIASVRAALDRLTRDRDRARDDQRIAAWEKLTQHVYFRELHTGEGPWIDVLVEHFDRLHNAGIAPAETQAAAARMAPSCSRGFGIAVSRDGVGHASTVDADDSGPAGLARLRAHSALDGLLDQHGASR